MNLRQRLRLLYFSEFFIFFHLFSGVLIPYYFEWGGLTMTKIMILQAWFCLCVIVLEIPTGALADQIGRKKTLVLGSLANAVGVLFYGFFHSYFLFFIAEFFWALSNALFSGAKEAMVYDTLLEHGEAKKSHQAFAWLKTSAYLGMLIAPPIGSQIAELYGIQVPMMLTVFPMVLAAIFLIFVPEPKVHANGQGGSFTEHMKKGWRFFKNHPVLKVMASDMVITWSLCFILVWLQQAVLIQIGVPIAHFGWFISFALLMQILVLHLYPWLERVFHSKKTVLQLSGFLPGVGFLLLAFYPSLITVILAYILCSGFGMTRRTLYSSYTNRYIQSSDRATVNSFINIGISMAGLVFRPIAGVLSDYDLGLALFVLGVLCILVTLFSEVEEDMLLD